MWWQDARICVLSLKKEITGHLQGGKEIKKLLKKIAFPKLLYACVSRGNECFLYQQTACSYK